MARQKRNAPDLWQVLRGARRVRVHHERSDAKVANCALESASNRAVKTRRSSNWV